MADTSSTVRQRKAKAAPTDEVAPVEGAPAQRKYDPRSKADREAAFMRRIEEEAYEFNHPMLVFAFALGCFLVSFCGNHPKGFEGLILLPTEMQSQPLQTIVRFIPSPLSNAYRLFHGIITGAEPPVYPIEHFLEREEPLAWNRLLKNVHPRGTAPGCVVASPSRATNSEEPNYWYQWTRDSALVMRTVVQAYIDGDLSHEKNVRDYIEASADMQQRETVIGGFRDGGLGEVKYNVDRSPFTGEWGRPQNDGPASRVITMAMLANHWLDGGKAEDVAFVKKVLYDAKEPTDSVIKGDLDHIAQHYAKPGFDLWEEVSGSHFYTLLSIQTALYHGSDLAARLEDPNAATYFRGKAEEITPLLREFFSPEKNIIRVSLGHAPGRQGNDDNAYVDDPLYGKTSELDTAVILAILHAGKATEWEQSDKVAATLHELIEVFKPVYPLNKARSIPALGRYPEDKYDGVGITGAHPWYLCTLAVAEYVYKLAALSEHRTEPLVVSELSAKFYARFGLEKGEVKPGSEEMKKLKADLIAFGDEFVKIVKEFVQKEGALSEQFDKKTGRARGARDLTWSYAAFITAAEARKVATA